MSVVGFDFGNDACYISIARAGGIETITNDYSLRATPSCVAFGPKNRILGVAAKNQIITNLRNTIFDFKRLLGRKLNDPWVQEELHNKPYQVVETDRGIGIKVPAYYTDPEKRSLLASAEIAGLNVLCLLNETTATALTYGLYKQDLPPPQDKSRNVFFLDFGQSSLQVFACAFNQGKLKMLCCTTLPDVGGRTLDLLLAKYFAEEFRNKQNLDVCSHARAFLRLLAEVEKLKKLMSANSTELPFSIECLLEDKDVSGRMCRAEFEKLAEEVLYRIEDAITKCLHDSGLNLSDIHSVEIVGGSSRLPAVKQIITKVFGIVPSTTLNADESVARGCAIQCAILSPTFKVREFSVVDCQQYTIKLHWDGSHGEEGDMKVFSRFDPVPFSRMLTFYRKQPFSLRAEYFDPICYPDPVIGIFTVKNIQPTADGNTQKVKVKVRINSLGLFTVCRATIVELQEIKQEDVEMNSPEAVNTVPNIGDPTSVPPVEGTADAQNSQEPAASKSTEAKPKVKKVEIELPIEACLSGYTQQELMLLRDEEGKMAAQDLLEKERIDAKNAVEEYVYEMRSCLGEKLHGFMSLRDQDNFMRLLDDAETWIYEEGEDCQKHVYVEKLTNLHKHGDPVFERHREFEGRQHAVNEINACIQQAQNICSEFYSGKVECSHLDAAEVEKAQKHIHEKQTWVDQQVELLKATPKHKDPPVLISQFHQEKQRFVMPILHKPKPKVEAPPPEKAEPAPEQPAPTGDGDKNGEVKKTEAMEVD